ncbi:MAG: hypothetical protein Q8K00_16200 [Syntrophales bacterium]|nr:hypothetical protein [Syntrophales bacterium]
MMKPSTIHSLMTAKAIYYESKPLIEAGNRYSSSAGLILLQDAIELVLLALLIELGVDEQKNLDSKSFDELLGELRKAGITIPKSGTIKALNKQRVLIKHYGQLAEPATVLSYSQAADFFIESVLKQVVGKTLNEVFLTDLLPECEAKELLRHAIQLKDSGVFLEALIETRKAFFVEYEDTYAIHEWADVDQNDTRQWGLALLGKVGHNAPLYTMNKQWIERNVNCPLNYVQIDREKLRLHAIEWGVSTSEIENLRRLTPAVFRANKESSWQIDYSVEFPSNEANEQNCNYCLDITINILRKKKEHEHQRRWPRKEIPFDPPPIYIGHPVYVSARRDSEVVHTVSEGFLYMIHRVVTGFNSDEEYLYVSGNEPPDESSPYGKNHFGGYLFKVE